MARRPAATEAVGVKTQPILVAVDGSPASDSAIATALELAGCIASPVTFIHSSAVAERLFATNREDGPSQEQIAANDPVLADALARAGAADVEATIEIVSGPEGTGDLAAVIAGTADGLGAGLIVCGSRGRSAATGAVLGSVSHNLIRYASVPVLVVHPRA